MSLSENIIPFNCVPIQVWHKLANKLDPDSPLMGNNWKMLAENLGYSVEQILNIESQTTHHGRNTLKLFHDYITKSGNSVNNVKKAIEGMDRPDALDVLLDSMPEIEKRFRNERKADPKENSFYSEPMSYSNEFHTLPHASTLHHNIPQKPNYPSSGVHTNCSSVVTKELNTMAPLNFHHQPMMSNPNIPLSTHQLPGYRNNSLTSVSGSSLSPSLTVHLDSFSASDTDMRELSRVQSFKEEPAPFPYGMFKGENNIPSLNRVQGLLNPLNMNVSHDETDNVTTMSAVHQQGGSRKRSDHLLRQSSDESNSKQPNIDLRAYGNSQIFSQYENKNPGIPSNNPLAKLKQLAVSDSYIPDMEYNLIMEEKRRTELLYHKNNVDYVKLPVTNGQYPLQNGQHPNNHTGEVRNPQSFPLRGTSNAMPPPASSNIGPLENSGKITYRDLKNFPVRSRSLQQEMVVSGSSESSQDMTGFASLAKSQSLPAGLKSDGMKSNAWHVKVLVTYSGRNNKHVQKVLSLSKCLSKNGFTCCMDMYKNEVKGEQTGNEWCYSRFQEADFVLVCISPNYNIDATTPESTSETEEEKKKRLHTAFIYNLVKQELEVQHDSKRIVPLLFDDAKLDDMPVMLQGLGTYQWPQQYRDVMWFLTKPESRIKAHNPGTDTTDPRRLGEVPSQQRAGDFNISLSSNLGSLPGSPGDASVPMNS